MKKIIFALLAFAFAAVACVNEKGAYTPPSPEQGVQLYFDNATTEFDVKTAEEKQEVLAQVRAMVKNPLVSTEVESDSLVSLPIVRKNASEEYTCTVILTIDNPDLFEVTSLSYEKDGEKVVDGDIIQAMSEPEEGVNAITDTITFTIPAAVAKVGLDIAFDVDKDLAVNTPYEFNATFAEGTPLSSYGASSLDFAIVHSAPVHNPWVVIGSASEFTNGLYTEFFGVPVSPCNVTVAIHEHDFTDDSFIESKGEKVINPDKKKRTLKDQAYYRFCIPAYGYQMAKASVDAGDGVFEEEDLEYFEASNGLMFFLEKGTYDFISVEKTKDYPAPLCDDITTAEKTSYQSPFWAYDHSTGKCNFNELYDGYDPEYCTHYFNIGYDSNWKCSHNAQNFSICALICDLEGLYYGSPISFKFDRNEIEEDWDNYFKVDYNNDIDYASTVEGTLKSELFGSEDPTIVQIGFDNLYKDQVYYLQYGPDYGLALLKSADGKCRLAADQDIEYQVLGKKVIFNQSDKAASTVEYDENGGISKITLNMVAESEDGGVTAYYTETFTAGSVTAVDKYLGDWELSSQEFYGVASPSNPMEAAYPLSSNVRIEAVAGTNDLKIYGLIDSYYAEQLGINPDAYVVGSYDQETGQVIIPKQFFCDPVTGDAPAFEFSIKDPATGEEVPHDCFAYFMPTVSDLSGEPLDETYTQFFIYSAIVDELDAAALEYVDDPNYGPYIQFKRAPSDGSADPCDGFALYAYEMIKGEGTSVDWIYVNTYGCYLFPPMEPVPASFKPNRPKANITFNAAKMAAPGMKNVNHKFSRRSL